MKSWFWKGTLSAAIVFPALSGAAWAGGSDDHFFCSNATLKGLYMFAQSGYTTVNGSLVPEGVTGKDTFHGNGSLDTLATISIGGDIIPGDAAPGTYTVNSDCTGTLTVHMTSPVPDVHLDIFVAPDGSEYFTIQTDPGNVLSGIIRRVAP
jgi:hypothetical protein